MTLTGKGMMIWKVPSCEGGNPDAIAGIAEKAGLTHVLIKIANGSLPYNVDPKTKVDYVPPVVTALRTKGIQVWGWHYIYGQDPHGEARIAVARTQQFAMDGYVIDAESEYTQPGMDKAATTFMNDLRNGIPQTPIALCSFRFPSFHPQLPWKQFLNKCDINMPQVYWQNSHNPDSQLRRCVAEFQAMTPLRPVIPTGPIYKASGWLPTPGDITQFLTTARALNLSAANFFAWDYGRTVMTAQWDAMAAFPWPPYPTPRDIPDMYIEALNTHDPVQVVNLYTPDAVHITAEKTIQGTDAIRSWYSTFLSQTLPNAIFKLTNSSSTDSSRHFTWEATSTAGKVLNGNDTIGLNNSQIAYHYSSFSITTS